MWNGVRFGHSHVVLVGAPFSPVYVKLLLLGQVWLMPHFMHGCVPASPYFPAAWTKAVACRGTRRTTMQQIICLAMQDAKGQLSGVLPDLPSNGRYEYHGNS